ncbi:MAG: phosphatase PAP2 family protein [Chitinophagaceae bacterium]|nr:phosphatase PAP2 family protein [Chitinophagaceae bacterium]
MKQKLKKFWASVSVLSFEVLLVLSIFLASLFVFIYVTDAIFDLKSTVLDETVFNFLHRYVSEKNTSVMVFISFFASRDFLLPANVLIVIYFLFINKDYSYSIRIAAVALGSFAVMSLLKLYFQRPRPQDPIYSHVLGYSFPSGHAMSAMTFYGLLIYIVFKYVKNSILKWILIIFLIAVILAIGTSRVYLRVHYATDVLAGFSLGVIWLVISLWLISLIEHKIKSRAAI